ncbi:hypothetical protein PA598K_01351 [Paenibacillus sp. 598K]|uniref:hypothetical protein n=1 Tax=Paenibacillus sp. 598K TaxID=1117987 RepID=UPI000FF93F05|nr:hypothetical protein [Paenibacillus sp. 598K]GBF73066.1 hypothetical protein PA598K_01351 [Paenibacillus sp. 598K]
MAIAHYVKAGVHINDWVKVQLTPVGIEILRQQHEKQQQRIMILTDGTGPAKPFTMRTDEKGYASFQLWSLMERFGPHMGLQKPEPFTELIVLGTTIVDAKNNH